jgi:hypothetical protein
MSKSVKIINWDIVLKKSSEFQNQKPFKFGFIEEFFDREFYNRLYETYPKINDSWIKSSDHSKYQLTKFWGKNTKASQIVESGSDDTWSKEWNMFNQYAHSEEFLENFRKFSGVNVTKLKHFHLIRLHKGGFQLPHIHDVGPSTLILMIYFSKNWTKGDPGGTYMATEEDESKIIFEPYNLDNSMALFHDGPNAAHGTRYITNDVDRKALQITLEGYSEENGWTGGQKQIEPVEL